MRKFCDAETRNEFADFLKISRSQLSYVLFVKHPHSYYKTFEIPKKSGGTRVINAPYGELKFIQEQLNKRLAEYQKYIWEVKGVRPAISHGFEKGKSIITNAKIHRNKRYVVNLDIENFFGTFHFGRIVGFLRKIDIFAYRMKWRLLLRKLLAIMGLYLREHPVRLSLQIISVKF